MSCRIVTRDNQIFVYENDGVTPSKLYQDALNDVKDPQLALDMWAVARTPIFEDYTGKDADKENVTYKEVTDFYQNLNGELSEGLTPTEKFQVKSFMASNGIGNINELQDTLYKIFRSGEGVTLNKQEAIKSGLYSEIELLNIDLEAIQDLMFKIDKEVIRGNNMYVSPDDIVKGGYKDKRYKTLFGSYERVSTEEMYKNIESEINDFKNADEIEQVLKDSPYQELYEDFKNDKKFRERLLGRLSSLKRVFNVSIVNGKAEYKNIRTFDRLKKTAKADINYEKSISWLNELEGINELLWDSSQEQIKIITNRVAKFFVSQGIDLVGIEEKISDREATMEFVSELKTYLGAINRSEERGINLTDNDFYNFAKAYDKYFDKDSTQDVVAITSGLEGLNIVKVQSDLTDAELFDNHGLIKVGEDTYHKVKLGEDKSLMYERLYQKALNGELVGFETKTNIKDPLSKTKVLAEITDFVSKRDTGIKADKYEELSLLQLVWGHPEFKALNTAVELRNLSLVKPGIDTEYIKTQFIEDFYKYYLSEKYKNSELYRKVLSKFSFTNRDIQLSEPLSYTDIEHIEFKDELTAYAAIKKDLAIKSILNKDRVTNYSDEVLDAINDRDSVEEPTNTYLTNGNYVATYSMQNIIKIGNKIYKKIKGLIFGAVNYRENNLYYTDEYSINNEAPEYKTLEVEALKLTKPTTPIVQADTLSKAINTMVNSVTPQVTAEDKVFEKNLVDFIREKGVDVITDKAEVNKVLKESGYDINPMVEGFIGRGSSENITVNKDSITIRRNINSDKLRTMGNVVNANEYYAEKIREGLSKLLGKRYKPEYVKSFTASNYAGTAIRVPQEVWDDIKKEEEFNKIVRDAKELVKSEFDRFGDEKAFRDLGYNFLQTPQGNILGFEKDGKIYLDEDQLNNTTTVHELIHVFQSMLDIKAKKGDKKAQEIIAKRKEVFGDIAKQWMDFHEKRGNIGVGDANTIIDVNDNQVGKKYTLKATPQELYTMVKNQDSVLLEDVIDITELKKLTPSLKYENSRIRFSQNNENAGGALLRITGDEVNDITINFAPTELSKGADFIRKTTVRLLSHEVQHLYDYANGRNYGANSREIEDILTRSPQEVQSVIDGIKEEQSDKTIGKRTGLSIGLYLAYGGENRARKNELEENKIDDSSGVFNVEVPDNLLIDSDENLQEVINSLTPEQAQMYYDLGNYYFNYTIAPEYKINFSIKQLKDTIGFDLSSPVYAQRANESREEWAERLEKEVEAYVTAPEVAANLENLQKENPSLWQKVMDFIANLKSWLKDQVGLSDYQGDIMNMSKEEYISALGISVLKDDYSTAIGTRSLNLNIDEIEAVVETRDGTPIGFNYDTDQVARERFDIYKLTKIGEGSDRVVFDLGNNKVLKVAKTARGLEQNMYESDFQLSSEKVTPKTFEVGLNYVVKENVPRAKSKDIIPIYDLEGYKQIGESTVGQMLKDLSEFSQRDFDNNSSKLQEVFNKYGFNTLLSYELLYGDFKALRNWGYDSKTMNVVHLDGGTFGGVRMLYRYQGKTNMQDDDFREIYNKSRQLKKEYQDKDKYTMFQIIGVKAAQQNQDLLESYNKAVELESQGNSYGDIELETGWYKETGDWKYFSKEVLQDYKPKNINVELNKEYNLEDIIENEELFKLYPKLRNQKIKVYNGARRDTEVNTSRDRQVAKGLYENGVILINSLWTNNEFARAFTSDPRFEVLDKFKDFTYDGRGGLRDNVIGTLAHEVQHFIQREEGFPVGGNIDTIFKEGFKLTGKDVGTPLGELKDEANKLIDSDTTSNEDRNILKGFIWYLDEAIKGREKPSALYTNLLGEVEARSLEYILKLDKDWSSTPYFELRKEMEKSEWIQNIEKYVVRSKSSEQTQNFPLQHSSAVTMAPIPEGEDIDAIINKFKCE
jgi:hypothetical protein